MCVLTIGLDNLDSIAICCNMRYIVIYTSTPLVRIGREIPEKKDLSVIVKGCQLNISKMSVCVFVCQFGRSFFSCHLSIVLVSCLFVSMSLLWS